MCWNLRLFFLLLVATVRADWWTREPWQCDDACVANLLRPLQEHVNDCDLWEEWVLGIPSPHPRTGRSCSVPPTLTPLGYCPRTSGSQQFLSMCQRPMDTWRVVCVSSTDNLAWYRGWQTHSARNRSCLRWDASTNGSEPWMPFFADPGFGEGVGVHAHENFCRNPDGWHGGPWCFVEEGVREACFHACKSEESCVGRRLLLAAHKWDSSPEALPFFADLPPPSPVRFGSPVLLPLRHTNRLPTFHASCLRHTARTRHFGPWRPGSVGVDWVHGHNLQAPWHRCHFACEDAVLECLPVPDFAYFGRRRATASGQTCTPPTHIHDALQLVATQFHNDSDFGTQNPNLHSFWQLFSSPTLGGARNRFLQAHVERLADPFCFNIRPLLEGIEWTQFPELERANAVGVGCFVLESDGKQLASVSFEACFKQCVSDVSEPEFTFPNTADPMLAPPESQNDDRRRLETKRRVAEHFVERMDVGNKVPVLVMLTSVALGAAGAVVVCVLQALAKI